MTPLPTASTAIDKTGGRAGPSPEELERLAADLLPPDVMSYFRTGFASGETNEANRRALDRWRLVPRVLVDVSRISLDTVVLGRTLAAPIIVAPMASQRLAHPDGEIATARAAAQLGLGMILATSSTTPVEEIAGVPGLDPWFQLYPLADRGETLALVDRAVAAGASAIVVTVDLPPLGDDGATIALPPGTSWAHHGQAPEVERQLDWGYLEWLLQEIGVPTVVKGVMQPDDALRAAEAGAAGIVASNHGGRAHDGLLGVLDILPEIADRLAGAPSLSVELYVDGAIRDGLDVLRAMALGARAVLVGRPVLWALAVGGEPAVAALLARYVSGLALACGIAGLPAAAGATATLFRRPG